MDKLQQAKDQLLAEIMRADADDLTSIATAYSILCQTELSERTLDAQIKGKIFEAHCHHDEFPPMQVFDEED